MESVACYNKKRITVEKNKFVSTENMQQNCAGIEPYNDTTAVEGVKFSENDILIANIRPYLRKAWKAEFNGACSTDVLSITPTGINSDFLFHCIEKEDFFNYVMSAAKGSKMPRGDKQHIMEYTIYFPSEVEQKKVSAFIELLSKRIAKQRKLINAIKLYKRGVLNRIFQANSDWKISTIRDCLNYEQPSKYIVQSEKYDNNYKTPVLTANKAFVLGYTNEMDGIYNKGDVIIYDDFTMDTKYVDFDFKVKSSTIKMLTPKQEIDLYFMYNYFQFLSLKPEGHQRSYISIVEPMEIAIPGYEEQKRLSTLFILIGVYKNMFFSFSELRISSSFVSING